MDAGSRAYYPSWCRRVELAGPSAVPVVYEAYANVLLSSEAGWFLHLSLIMLCSGSEQAGFGG